MRCRPDPIPEDLLPHYSPTKVRCADNSSVQEEEFPILDIPILGHVSRYSQVVMYTFNT